jgi:hypothetical protein
MIASLVRTEESKPVEQPAQNLEDMLAMPSSLCLANSHNQTGIQCIFWGVHASGGCPLGSTAPPDTTSGAQLIARWCSDSCLKVSRGRAGRNTKQHKTSNHKVSPEGRVEDQLTGTLIMATLRLPKVCSRPNSKLGCGGVAGNSPRETHGWTCRF